MEERGASMVQSSEESTMADEKKEPTPATTTPTAAPTPTNATMKAIKEEGKPFTFSGGGPNFPFAIYGEGFGATPGTVMIGGLVADVTKWSDTVVKGTVPSAVKKGKTTVSVGGKSLEVTV